MKNSSKKISANEINRFVYCPYQWYYARAYGSKTLREQYKALGIDDSGLESNFVKGQKFHRRYYRNFRLKRALQILLSLLFIGLLAWRVIRWQ